MSEINKVLIDLPLELLKEIEFFASRFNCTPSEFIQVAVKHYIEDKQNYVLTEQMIEGYQKMAEINLQIAEEFVYSDNEALNISKTENKLITPS